MSCYAMFWNFRGGQMPQTSQHSSLVTRLMWFAKCFWIAYLNLSAFFSPFVLNSCFVPHLCYWNLTVINYRLGLIKWLLWPSFAQPVLFVLSFVDWNALFVAYLQHKWIWLDFADLEKWVERFSASSLIQANLFEMTFISEEIVKNLLVYKTRPVVLNLFWSTDHLFKKIIRWTSLQWWHLMNNRLNTKT